LLYGYFHYAIWRTDKQELPIQVKEDTGNVKIIAADKGSDEDSIEK
jgi:hypothetical protein